VEPFDEALDKVIWSLADQRLKLDQQIAIKRRTKPLELQNLLERDFERQISLDEDVALGLEEQVQEIDLDDPLPDRYHKVRQTLAKIATVTRELDQSIPVQLERCERLNIVSYEVENLRSH